jgi:two-component system phosphate regulon sensor histidine kinase PhoR
MAGRLRTLAASYRMRLVLGYALVVALFAGAWAWSLYGPLTQSIVEEQRTHLRTIAQASAIALSQTSAAPATEVQQLVAGTEVRMTIVDAAGTVVADSVANAATMENHLSRPEIRAALGGRVGYDTRTSATLGVPQLYVAVPATLDRRPVALRVSEPLSQVDALAASARQSGLLLLLGALALAVYVGTRVSRSAAEPVLRLKAAAEAMAAGDLRTPIPSLPGEIGGLADALGVLRDGMRSTIGDLEAEQATLRTVLDGLQDAVFLLEGDRITLANRAASTLFRAPAGGWRGAALDETGLPASLAADIASRLPNDETSSGEIGPDPEQRYLRVTAIPLNPTDAEARTLVVVSDVTERRRLEQVRRDFVANASHELKTPASAIQLLADAADTAAKDGDAHQALVFVTQMRAEADRLRRLVIDLLDLSRLDSVPEAGTISDVRAALDNALAAHRPAATAAGLTLALDDAPVAGEDIFATAEPTDVAIILDNLLANAIAYTAEGGVSVRLSADGAKVSIEVADTGPGIAAEHLPRVFERFYRVDGARTRSAGGTGLGLSLVRNAAERSGGGVSIASDVGRGTTVTVHLPRAL